MGIIFVIFSGHRGERWRYGLSRKLLGRQRGQGLDPILHLECFWWEDRYRSA